MNENTTVEQTVEDTLEYMTPSQREALKYLGDEAYAQSHGRALARAEAKHARRAARYKNELNQYEGPEYSGGGSFMPNEAE